MSFTDEIDFVISLFLRYVVFSSRSDFVIVYTLCSEYSVVALKFLWELDDFFPTNHH